jgi:hypothetical protein
MSITNILSTVGLLAVLGVLGYFQNMAFTWSSRTRNQNDPDEHRKAAWCSNGVWYIMQVTIWGTMWAALTKGNFFIVGLTGLVYVISTTEGSVHMMKILIKKGR